MDRLSLTALLSSASDNCQLLVRSSIPSIPPLSCVAIWHIVYNPNKPELNARTV
jgi:hypothetical protein